MEGIVRVGRGALPLGLGPGLGLSRRRRRAVAARRLEDRLAVGALLGACEPLRLVRARVVAEGARTCNLLARARHTRRGQPQLVGLHRGGGRRPHLPLRGRHLQRRRRRRRHRWRLEGILEGVVRHAGRLRARLLLLLLLLCVVVVVVGGGRAALLSQSRLPARVRQGDRQAPPSRRAQARGARAAEPATAESATTAALQLGRHRARHPRRARRAATAPLLAVRHSRRALAERFGRRAQLGGGAGLGAVEHVRVVHLGRSLRVMHVVAPVATVPPARAAHEQLLPDRLRG